MDWASMLLSPFVCYVHLRNPIFEGKDPLFSRAALDLLQDDADDDDIQTPRDINQPVRLHQVPDPGPLRMPGRRTQLALLPRRDFPPAHSDLPPLIQLTKDRYPDNELSFYLQGRNPKPAQNQSPTNPCVIELAQKAVDTCAAMIPPSRRMLVRRPARLLLRRYDPRRRERRRRTCSATLRLDLPHAARVECVQALGQEGARSRADVGYTHSDFSFKRCSG
ncbi:hypothetical protein CORC01_01323 [Colletotrichum orchidophilum]|uniref:Uncharacterized protein n=1 Tax=Colletotrichum orchidophilum TaxID=1209926 RepID=A0A1G4BP76_9PEZI|nr:uncharacterized protein CORC01_01323 [Colletotrichum orchidophilum]OHF03270.1 hypothetical protein CORC01_01323 [Colletotrichum orchidophilum]